MCLTSVHRLQEGSLADGSTMCVSNPGQLGLKVHKWIGSFSKPSHLHPTMPLTYRTQDCMSVNFLNLHAGLCMGG